MQVKSTPVYQDISNWYKGGYQEYRIKVTGYRSISNLTIEDNKYTGYQEYRIQDTEVNQVMSNEDTGVYQIYRIQDTDVDQVMSNEDTGVYQGI